MTEKTYTIILIPDAATTEAVGKIRGKYGDRLVDGLPPHVTIKRRFQLKTGVTEGDAAAMLAVMSAKAPKADVAQVGHLGDALAIGVASAELVLMHVALQTLMAEKTIGSQPSFEGMGFKPHMTIVRDPESKVSVTVEELGITTMTFTEARLYELDPERGPARLVIAKDLH